VRARIYLSCSARSAQLEVVLNSRRIQMAKPKKVVSKKVVAPAEVPVEAVPMVAAVPVVAEAAEAPAPTQVPTPSTPVRARKEKAVDEPSVKWGRRLKRWQAKAQAAGVDAKALMSEIIAG
jgi:hypothetical protein